MSFHAVAWAMEARVGNGKLKATLVAIACCGGGEPIKSKDLVLETGLRFDTVNRHLGALIDLGFISKLADGRISINRVSA